MVARIIINHIHDVQETGMGSDGMLPTQVNKDPSWLPFCLPDLMHFCYRSMGLFSLNTRVTACGTSDISAGIPVTMPAHAMLSTVWELAWPS